MRILYFSRDYTPHDLRFLSALSRTKHNVAYLRLEQRGHALEDRPLPPQIEQIRWKGGQRPVDWREGLRLLPDLRRVIHEFQPDLIQAGPLQRSAFMVALTGFRPLVSMSWGYDLIHDVHRGAAWAWATRYTLRRSSSMIGDCDTIRRLAVQYGMPDGRIVTFPWGIDLEHFSPPSQQPRADDALQYKENQPFTILSTRGWEPIYGTGLIARAFSEVAKEHPELHLIMLGNGSQAAELHRIFEQYGVADRITFPGYVSREQLPSYYRQADLYISASHSDGSSISLLEAMACGTPALVSDIPGNQEWINPGENGWWFPDGDWQLLAQGIRKALAKRSQLHEMGLAARRTAEERADWNKNFQQLLQAFKLALQP